MMTEEMIDLIDCDTSRLDVAEMQADYLQKELDELADKYELMVRRNCELKQCADEMRNTIGYLRTQRNAAEAQIEELKQSGGVLKDDMSILNMENTELTQQLQSIHMQEQSDFYEDCPF